MGDMMVGAPATINIGASASRSLVMTHSRRTWWRGVIRAPKSDIFARLGVLEAALRPGLRVGPLTAFQCLRLDSCLQCCPLRAACKENVFGSARSEGERAVCDL